MDLTQDAAPAPLDNRHLAIINNNPGMWGASIWPESPSISADIRSCMFHITAWWRTYRSSLCSGPPGLGAMWVQASRDRGGGTIGPRRGTKQLGQVWVCPWRKMGSYKDSFYSNLSRSPSVCRNRGRVLLYPLFVRGSLAEHRCSPFKTHSFTLGSHISASQDPPHCLHSTPTQSLACWRSVHHGRCFSSPRPPTQPSPSSCECGDRSGWPQRTLSDPPPVRSQARLLSHKTDKQERDPFLPTATQTQSPAPPLPSHSEGNPLPHSTSCLTGMCEEKKTACVSHNYTQ